MEEMRKDVECTTHVIPSGFGHAGHPHQMSAATGGERRLMRLAELSAPSDLPRAAAAAMVAGCRTRPGGGGDLCRSRAELYLETATAAALREARMEAATAAAAAIC